MTGGLKKDRSIRNFSRDTTTGDAGGDDVREDVEYYFICLGFSILIVESLS